MNRRNFLALLAASPIGLLSEKQQQVDRAEQELKAATKQLSYETSQIYGFVSIRDEQEYVTIRSNESRETWSYLPPLELTSAKSLAAWIQSL